MPTRVLFLLFIFTISSGSFAFAQLSDLYADFAKLTYQTVHGCPVLKAQDFTSKDVCTPANSPDNVADLTRLHEEVFFANEAQEELESLQCGLKTFTTLRKNPDAQKKIAADWAEKVKLATPIFTAWEEAKLELLREQTQARSQMRSITYHSAYAKMTAAENKVTQLEQALAAIKASVWQGNSQTVSSLFSQQVRSGVAKDADLAAQIRADLPATLLKLNSEFTTNQNRLSAQRQGPSAWSLSTDTKKMLFSKAKENNSFQSKYPDSPDLQQGMECRLEGKYGKGQDYADNTLLAGTLLASGGTALFARAGFALRATVARGVHLGRVSEQAGSVMLKTAIGLNATTALADIDKHCLGSNHQFVTQKNLCAQDSAALIGSEIKKLEQGNCVLAIGLSGAASPLIAGAGKALRDLKAPGILLSLIDKGDEFLSRTTRSITIPREDLAKYTRETEDYLKSLGMQTEKITSETLPNYDKIKKIDRVKKLREQLEAQEKSLSVVEEKVGSESLQGALYGNTPRINSGEDGALQRLLTRATPLNREENIKHIQDEIALLEKEISKAPDTYSDKPLSAFHDDAGIGLKSEGVSENYGLHKVISLPKNKGKAHYDTAALLHPEMQKDLDELKRIGVDVRIDPALKASADTMAFYHGFQEFKGSRVINMGASASYETFKHEKTHALFTHYVQPKMSELKIAAKEGKSLDSVLTVEEMRGFGASNLKSLEKNLKKENTELALNERMAVDAQLKEMGLMRYSPSGIDRETYALRHQAEGYEQIFAKNQKLTANQELNYQLTLAKAGALVSYQEGAREAQRFMQSMASPSPQSAQALARRIANLKNEKEDKKDTYFFDQKGRLLVLQADGTWKRFNTK